MTPTRLLPAATGLALILLVGWLHGIETDRWGMSPDVAAAAARLKRVPKTIGPWQSQELEVLEAQLTQAEAVGHLARVYVNSEPGHELAGEAVQVMILCGRPGPIAVHPPTVCFKGAGYSQLAPEEAHAVEPRRGKPIGEFWRTTFRKSVNAVPQNMTTLWAWTTGGQCRAAEAPRREFAGEGYLYKVYVTRVLDSPRDDAEDDKTCDKFLELFLPKLEQALAVEGT